MRFEYPLFLFLLATIPLLYRFTYREASKRAAAISYSDLKTLRDRFRKKSRYRGTLFALRVLALGVIAVTLARPQLEKGFETVESEGIDIMLALDISGSMRAEDFKPENRLHVAKQVVSDFVGGITNDRVGLVAFASKSFTKCPLTLDHDVLRAMLDDVEIGMIEDGTAIGLALANCVARLDNSRAKSRIIILLTDGENTTGEIDPLTGAKLSEAAGMKTYTIGVGKEGGAPVPVPDRYGRMQYARDRNGNLMLTKLDEETLREIARITGGQYYRATDEKALDDIYKQILEMEKTAFEVKTFKHRKELANYFLPFGLLAMLAEVVLVSIVWRKIP